MKEACTFYKMHGKWEAEVAFTTVISTDDLAAHLTDPAWAIIDCRFQLADDAWGEREHAAGHVPRAAYAHLGRDLSAVMNGHNGRHPLPDPATAAETFGRLGITNDMQVVAYDQDAGSFASRLWWMLRWLGHDAVAVLDGSFAKWTAEHRTIESGDARPAPRQFIGRPRRDMLVDAAGVARLLGRPDVLLLDARAPERYRGDIEPIDRVPGHIPGAVNYCFQQNVDERGVLRSTRDLRAQLSAALGDVPADHVVCYCGSGVTACHNLLALERAGMTGAKLYAGSWSEWSSDPSRPMDRSTA